MSHEHTLLIHSVVTELMSFLESKGAEHLLFSFRWLLIDFKREFSFEMIKTLWEVSLAAVD